MTIQRHHVGKRLADMVVHGGTIYLAGQVADDPTPSVGEQTRQVLAKIDELLKSAGTDKTRILSANVWLADIGRFAEMNAVWDKWVAAGHAPARATVQAALARPEFLVEIMVVAARIADTVCRPGRAARRLGRSPTRGQRRHRGVRCRGPRQFRHASLTRIR